MRTLLFFVIGIALLFRVYGQEALAVEKVFITVEDLERSVSFYEEILGFEVVATDTLLGRELQGLMGISSRDLEVQIAELALGEEIIGLMEFSGKDPGRPVPVDSRSNDLWFQHLAIVVGNMHQAYEVLRKAGVTHVSTAPQTLPEYLPEAAGIEAFYFRDPDGHNLELIHYPIGKGNPKWQHPSDRLFLGIDHTAIAIENTAESKHFYEGLIGLKEAGKSENYGTEQEHLNQVFGARLLIHGLRARQGIGVEFLEYLAPPGGRPYPEDSSPADVWHWHTQIRVPDLEQAYVRLQQAGARMISQRMVTIGGNKQFMVRDADGHTLLLTE